MQAPIGDGSVATTIGDYWKSVGILLGALFAFFLFLVFFGHLFPS